MRSSAAAAASRSPAVVAPSNNAAILRSFWRNSCSVVNAADLAVECDQFQCNLASTWILRELKSAPFERLAEPKPAQQAKAGGRCRI